MMERNDPAHVFLQSKLQTTLSSVVPHGQDYALLDFPDHSNVGDSAIFMGQLSILQSVHQSAPAYVCSMRSYFNDPELALIDGPLYLHGGGNFGDLWPTHQIFRETILRNHPDKKVIQLPQSIHFNSDEALEKAATAIGMHPDFTLMVRDKQSFDLAKKNFSCSILLCPDAAHGLGDLSGSQQATIPILCMIRTDSESGLTSEEIKEIHSYGPVQDWLEDTGESRLELKA
ncbi:MAG: polysaccharide pyruvyl transferase family protein [Loktanella sp.]|nr:polysaccharide pyruvyl transferase family protein [Loktanella sp.]